jgi:heme-degrading monooxygenase HmoA
VTVFRSVLVASRLRDYGAQAEQTEALARTMPGFVEFKTFAAHDAERCSIVIFDSWASHQAWRDHPSHQAVQAAGRERFYERYSISICELVDERRFSKTAS